MNQVSTGVEDVVKECLARLMSLEETTEDSGGGLASTIDAANVCASKCLVSASFVSFLYPLVTYG